MSEIDISLRRLAWPEIGLADSSAMPNKKDPMATRLKGTRRRAFVFGMGDQVSLFVKVCFMLGL